MGRPSVRGKLVDAACETLQAQGFNGCSIQNITDAAGVPKGSFFNHFKSKELLALEALDMYAANSRIDLLHEEGKAPLQRLRQHFEFLAERFVGWGHSRGCLLANFGAEMSDTHPAMREALASVFEAWSARVAGVLSEAQALGQVDPRHDAQELGRFVVNAWEGALIRAKVLKSRAPLDDFFEVCFRILLK